MINRFFKKNSYFQGQQNRRIELPLFYGMNGKPGYTQSICQFLLGNLIMLKPASSQVIFKFYILSYQFIISIIVNIMYIIINIIYIIVYIMSRIFFIEACTFFRKWFCTRQFFKSYKNYLISLIFNIVKLKHIT